MEKNLKTNLKSTLRKQEDKRVHFAMPGSQGQGLKRSKTSDSKRGSSSCENKETRDSYEIINNMMKCEEIVNTIEPELEELSAKSCAQILETTCAIDRLTEYALQIVDTDLKLKPIVENDLIELERSIERLDLSASDEMKELTKIVDLAEEINEQATSGVLEFLEQIKQDSEECNETMLEQIEKLEKILNDYYQQLVEVLKSL